VFDPLSKAWEKAAAPLWDSIQFWRISTLILITCAVAAWFLRKRIIRWLTRDKILAHDRKQFQKVDEILPELFTYEVLASIEGTAGVARDDSDRLHQFWLFFSLEQNQFQIRELRKASTLAAKDMEELSVFIARHFFSTNNVDYYRLYPNLADEGSREEHAKFAHFCDLLNERTEKARISYRAYRRAVKTKLLI